ncbi:hypothetical protein [Pseudomonas sp. TH31]|uniref:hypothetical protein n=1 Tax=Pseudomonas sp. TH31 TaxID=2796396 RepID=UPI001913B2DA|nr:hypothetical protein [Pseudomonas sp. TH31]MBK5414729.1 hypothetical protein [Pseudomonas sp. TH31]
MKTALYISIITAFGLAVIGCAKTTTNPNLVEARKLFTQLQNKPESYWLAADEVKEAFAILIQADLLSNVDAGSPEIDHLSQIIKQKIALAEQAISDRKIEPHVH